MTEWSEPDERGVRTHVVHVSPRRQISGERHRVADKVTSVSQVVLDDDRRFLLKDILGRCKSTWKWDRILEMAGHERVELAHELLSILLEAGYVKLIERRDARGWMPVRVEPTAARELR